MFFTMIYMVVDFLLSYFVKLNFLFDFIQAYYLIEIFLVLLFVRLIWRKKKRKYFYKK